MGERILKELNGFSGSKVYLMQDNTKTFVRKIDNVERNYERMQHLLTLGFNVPEIYNKTDNTLDIEYIPGLDIKTYLKFNQPTKLIEFLLDILVKLSYNSKDKDYTDVYQRKLAEIDFVKLPFTMSELLDKLPRVLPSSHYYGDLTLENIIYSKTGLFYLIDPVTIEYDSFVFDIAKLRQDLHCKWFLRHDTLFLDAKLKLIESHIMSVFPNAIDNYLLILMLLRVYRHAESDSFEKTFLLMEIDKLWKL